MHARTAASFFNVRPEGQENVSHFATNEQHLTVSIKMLQVESSHLVSNDLAVRCQPFGHLIVLHDAVIFALRFFTGTFGLGLGLGFAPLPKLMEYSTFECPACATSRYCTGLSGTSTMNGNELKTWDDSPPFSRNISTFSLLHVTTNVATLAQAAQWKTDPTFLHSPALGVMSRLRSKSSSLVSCWNSSTTVFPIFTPSNHFGSW
mmetsp:Transcript_28856/g.76116  ORF Transcript_28856/g.76116 Transcript_28856/m.76116 type:complete len:205 (+) Transcript_28856:631-1245(+)